MEHPPTKKGKHDGASASSSSSARDLDLQSSVVPIAENDAGLLALSVPPPPTPLAENPSPGATFFATATGVVVANVYSFLSTQDLVHVAISSKAIAASQADEASLWAELVWQRLNSFAPARAFFRGLKNAWNGYQPFGDDFPEARFPAAAASADTALFSSLAASGCGSSPSKPFPWEWELTDAYSTEVDAMHDFGGDGWPTCHYRQNILPRLQTMDTSGVASLSLFGAWSAVFVCSACNAPGAAARQCAACGDLLCLDCSVRCDFDGRRNPCGAPEPRVRARERLWAQWAIKGGSNRTVAEFETRFEEIAAVPTARCAFALCRACHDTHSVQEEHPSRDTVLMMEGESPGLITSPICRICPSVGNCLCPAHADYVIVDCYDCGDARCYRLQHNMGDDDHALVEKCRGCRGGGCQAFSCFESRGGRRVGYCMDCYTPMCTDCTPCSCPECGMERMRLTFDPIDHRF